MFELVNLSIQILPNTFTVTFSVLNFFILLFIIYYLLFIIYYYYTS